MDSTIVWSLDKMFLIIRCSLTIRDKKDKYVQAYHFILIHWPKFKGDNYNMVVRLQCVAISIISIYYVTCSNKLFSASELAAFKYVPPVAPKPSDS